MGHQWINIMKEGNIAMKNGEYSLASRHYIEVLEEAERNLKRLRHLSVSTINIVIEFALYSRVTAKAVLQNGHLAEAENIFLKANEALISIISNLKYRQIFRAITFTHFKGLYHDLAYFYASTGQMHKLYSYISSHKAVVERWTKELKLLNNGNLGRN